MNFLIGFYVAVACAWILFMTLHHEVVAKAPSIRWRLGLGVISGILWPAVILLSLFLNNREVEENKKQNRIAKEDILFHYLLWNSPDWRKKYVFEKEDKKFLYNYMEKYFPDGISAIRNPSVGRTEFALMVEQEVKHPIHEHGFCKGVTEWYTKGRD